jgi:hypothetical protein
MERAVHAHQPRPKKYLLYDFLATSSGRHYVAPQNARRGDGLPLLRRQQTFAREETEAASQKISDSAST